MPKYSNKSDEPTFEQSLAELERVVEALESGELGLGDALETYEVGVKHLKACHHMLEKAERRIQLLSGVDVDGKAVCEPFEEHVRGDLAEQAATRSRKRTAVHNAVSPDEDGSGMPIVDDPESLF
jgi:exodeoxyribonuclease VII small subunit